MITFTRDWNGYPAGASVGTLAATTEAAAVAAGAAVYGGTSYPLRSGLDRYGNVTSLVDGDGISFLRGPVASGVWITQPSVFRLRLTGSGTATMDARDSLGNITNAVAVFTANGATDQIEFPYAGDNAVTIRVTLTGTLTCEVI